MNAPRKSNARRRVLIVAFHYPPIQGSSGVHRSLAFSRYLPEFGWDVSVLTVTPRAHESVLVENLELVPSHVSMIRAQAWDAARHFAVFGRYPSRLALPDRWSSWIPFAVLAATRAHQSKAFDALFTTFPIASAHVIGSRVHRRASLPWVADFRDPMATATYPHEPSLRALWMKIQDAAVRQAACVTLTTPGAAAYYRRTYPDVPPDRFEVIENGFDPETFPESASAPAAAKPTVLLHSGVLYPRERDPAPFLRALVRLRERGLIAADSLRVRLRATGFDSDYRTLLSQMNLLDLVELAPSLPYVEALREIQCASALLLFQARVCNDQIPAKTYEYLYAGRPILGLADAAGDTGQLLRRFGVPGIAALEDEEGIVAMLERSLPRIRDGSYPVASRDAVMSVSRRLGAARLGEILDRATTLR